MQAYRAYYEKGRFVPIGKYNNIPEGAEAIITVLDKKEDDGFYSKKNLAFLRKSIDELERGEVIIKTIEELEAMTNNEVENHYNDK